MRFIRSRLQVAASQTRTAVTDAGGGFQILDLAPATYSGQVKAGDAEIARIVGLNLAAGHRRVLAATTIGLHSLFEGEDPPSPSVLFATYRGSNLVRLDLVEGDEPELKGTVTSSEGLPTDADWKQVRSEIAPFFAAMSDVTSGPERFEPFLHQRVVCRLFYSGERSIATINERRCVTSVLENTSLWSLLAFEGFENPGVASRDLGDPFFLQPRKASDEEHMAVLLRRQGVLRNELLSAARRDPEHFARVRQYLQMSMSTMPIMVVSMLPDEMLRLVPELRGRTVYVVGGGFFFTREGSELRLAAVIAGGG